MRSRSTVYRWLKDGLLEHAGYLRGEPGHWRIESDPGDGRPPFRQWALTVLGAQGPIRQSELEPGDAAPSPAAAPPAAIWAPWANALLDCDLWTPPPWDSTHWWSLAITIEEAEQLAAEHGPLTPEALARWELELADE